MQYKLISSVLKSYTKLGPWQYVFKSSQHLIKLRWSSSNLALFALDSAETFLLPIFLSTTLGVCGKTTSWSSTKFAWRINWFITQRTLTFLPREILRPVFFTNNSFVVDFYNCWKTTNPFCSFFNLFRETEHRNLFGTSMVIRSTGIPIKVCAALFRHFTSSHVINTTKHL